MNVTSTRDAVPTTIALGAENDLRDAERLGDGAHDLDAPVTRTDTPGEDGGGEIGGIARVRAVKP